MFLEPGKDKTATDFNQLLALLETGGKPKDKWCIGIEHEAFPFYLESLQPVPYKNEHKNRGGIREILEELSDMLGWKPVAYDDTNVVSLIAYPGGPTVTLEPGGQLELSSHPLPNVHAIARELDTYLTILRRLKDKMNINFLSLGSRPWWTTDSPPVMPIPRYDIMAPYMRKVGTHGTDMMRHTASTQVSLDYRDEQDMVIKLRVSLALHPLVTALFSASPALNSRFTGAFSSRSYIWQHTDNHRTGLLPFAFKPDFGFRDYMEWALDTPMYFVKRGLVYHDMTQGTGITFRQFMNNEHRHIHPSISPTVQDWENHISTLFPEVRLKHYIEQRGADSGPRSHVLALPALWTGLLYDENALDEISRLVSNWEFSEIEDLSRKVPFSGLGTRFRGRQIREISQEVLAIAASGLKAREKKDEQGQDETIYLTPLEEISETGVTLAEKIVNTHWIEGKLQVHSLFEDYSLI